MFLLMTSFMFFSFYTLGHLYVCQHANTLLFLQWSTVPGYTRIYYIWCSLCMLDTIPLFFFSALEAVMSSPSSVFFFTDHQCVQWSPVSSLCPIFYHPMVLPIHTTPWVFSRLPASYISKLTTSFCQSGKYLILPTTTFCYCCLYKTMAVPNTGKEK